MSLNVYTDVLSHTIAPFQKPDQKPQTSSSVVQRLVSLETTFQYYGDYLHNAAWIGVQYRLDEHRPSASLPIPSDLPQ